MSNKTYTMYRISGEYDEKDQLFPTLKLAALSLKRDYNNAYRVRDCVVEGLFVENDEIKHDNLSLAEFIIAVQPTEDDLVKVQDETQKLLNRSREQDRLWQENRQKAKAEGQTICVTGSCDPFKVYTEQDWIELEKNIYAREFEKYSWTWNI